MTYELSEELVDRHRRATEQEPYPDPALAPVSILAADGVNLADRFWDISQSVHAGQCTRVLGLPRVGDTLRVRGTAREKFVKRGRRYVVSDVDTTDSRDRPVAHGQTTGVLVYAEHDEDAPPAPSPPPPAPEEPALRALAPLGRTLTREAMILYEPSGEQNLHTSDAIARAAGLPASIATGTLFLAYLFDLLYREYGMGSLVGTELDVRIRQPVFAGDRVVAEADVLPPREGRIPHRVRCRGPRGDVIVGRAWVPEP